MSRVYASLALATIALTAMLMSCASQAVRHGPYGIDGPVVFEGLEFTVNSVEYTKESANWLGQPLRPSDTFIIVDLSVKNLRGKPLPYQFQPVYQLIDDAGSEYSASNQQTVMINMTGQSGASLIETLNPNVTRRMKVVFDAPSQAYRMQVIVPNVASAGLLGTMDVAGPWIEFALPLKDPATPGKVGIFIEASGVITRVVPDSPASIAGLQVGDKVTAIDGRDVSSADPQAIARMVRGNVGTAVLLEVIRGRDTLQFQLIRTVLAE